MRILFFVILMGFASLLSAQTLDATFATDWKHIYFIKGNKVVVHNSYDRTTKNIGAISDAFPGVTFKQIDAALNYGNGKIYLFSGADYVRLDKATLKMDEGYPKSTADYWAGVGSQKIDAAVSWNNGKSYLFRYGIYSRYDRESEKTDEGYPKSINNATWPGLTYKMIDACFSMEGTTYFFSGNEFVKFDNEKDETEGAARSINEWQGLLEALKENDNPQPEPAVVGIDFFKGTWDEALEESKRTGKPIFMDAYAAWCGPCKWMAKNTFPDKTVGEYFNEHFINLKIDMEKGEGRQLARDFQVRAYPTLLFIDGDAKVISKVEGARQPDGLLALGKATMTKIKAAPTPSPEVEEKGIEFFEGTWDEALAESKRTGKPIFMDAYAAWCGPCKWMARNTFPDPSVGAYYNKNFICVKMDMEKGEGPSLARKFGVRAYPTLLYINSDGKVIKRTEGARGAQDFIQLGKSAMQ
jgi:thiol-disulfide isomerase/thioredoxin